MSLRATRGQGGARVAFATVPAVAGAHPSAGDFYVPWVEKVGKQRSVQFMQGSVARAAALAAPGSANMSLVGIADKDGTTNSDLAFCGNLAYATTAASGSSTSAPTSRR